MPSSPSFTRALEFLDSWLAYHAVADGLPGFSVAIARRGELVYAKAFGYADVGAREPLTTEHAFNVGSQAKMITATAVMQQVQRGRIGLNTPAAAYLPWLREHHDARFSHFTIRQLLSHQAGLARDGADADHWQLLHPFPDAAELRHLILSSELILGRAVKFKYSNLGYALLGQVLEAVTGQTYAGYVHRHIAQPLGLGQFAVDDGHVGLQPVARGYLRAIAGRRHPVPHYVPSRAFTPVTGVYASPEAMCRFMAAQAQPRLLGLDGEAAAELHHGNAGHWQPPHQRGTKYGLGFGNLQLGQRQVIGHGGGFIGHTSASYYDPHDQLAVTVMANAKDAPAKLMVEGIFSVFDFFQANVDESLPEPPGHLNARLMNAWTTIEIVTTPKCIVTIYPDEWLPFGEVVDELSYDATTGQLAIKHTHDMDAEREQVVFNLGPDGAVRSVRRAGALLWPEHIYLKTLE